MAWMLLVAAGVLEIGFAIAMDASDGLQKLVPSVLFVLLAGTSMVLLSLATKTLPIGTAYAVWTGIGAAGTAAVGIVLLGERAAAMRVAAIGLIVVGVVVLQLAERR
jgi:quaternary ammonium compound-resistance protein SugE